MDEQHFDQAVAGFYRAATGACTWDDALLPVQQAFRARAAALHPYAVSDGRLLGLHAAGGPNLDEALFDYLSEYHRWDPRKHLAVKLGPAAAGQWLHCQEHMDERFVQQDHFFQNYLPAYDTRYNANVSLPINDQVLMGFILELPAERGPLDPDERELARRLGCHLHDALLAYERLRQLMHQALAGHQLLQRHPYPMWLLDEQRGIHFENPAAVAECERERRMARLGQRLVLRHTARDQELARCLLALQRAGHAATATLDLRPTLADAPQWLHLSLLVPDATLGAFGQRPMVLATLFDPQQISPLDPFALARMFQLTPTEAKVAAQLAEGLTAEQIGALHHTRESTVRSHIRQVLGKLGAQRVTDVVRMLQQGQALWARGPGGAVTSGQAGPD